MRENMEALELLNPIDSTAATHRADTPDTDIRI